MSRARGHSLERRFCLALVALSACLGCSSATDNGTGHAGTSGGGVSAAGTNSSGAGPTAAGSGAAGLGEGGASSGRGGGNALGGAPGVGGAHAGASAGGKAGAGTAGNPGGAGDTGRGGKSGNCEITECFVANTCLDKCGGSVVYTGCCSCEPPSVNEHTCSGMN